VSTRLKNLFYRVAKDENSTTEILCNLMNFKIFREKFLAIFLSPELINKISFEDFETQVRLNEGQPDIIIENEIIKVIIEIKTEKYTTLTDNQPEGYINNLLTQKIENKWLIFILPKGYIYEKNITDKLSTRSYIFRQYRRGNPLCLPTQQGNHRGLSLQNTEEFVDGCLVSINDGNPSDQTKKQIICWDIIYWEDIIEAIESNGLNELNQIINEFYNFLRIWYIPERVKFDYPEIKTMYSSEIPDILTKLAKIVDEVYRKASDYDPYLITQRRFPPDEYGIYFYRKDQKGEKYEILFFGIWFPVWKEKNLPVCFGVHDSYSEKIKSVFEKQYHGRIISYSDWKLSWFNAESVFLKDDCIDEIWNTLEAFLSQVTQTHIKMNSCA